MTMYSLIQNSASDVSCKRLPTPCIEICERMINNLDDNSFDAIKSEFRFGISQQKLDCVLLASVIKRKEATSSNFEDSDFDSITLTRNSDYDQLTYKQKEKYNETFLDYFLNHTLYQRFDIYYDFYEDVLDSWRQQVDLENVEIFLRSFAPGESQPTTSVHDKIMDIFVYDSVRNLVILSVPIWLENSHLYSDRKSEPFPRSDTETVDLIHKHISKFKNLKAMKLVLSSPWILSEFSNFT